MIDQKQARRIAREIRSIRRALAKPEVRQELRVFGSKRLDLVEKQLTALQQRK